MRPGRASALGVFAALTLLVGGAEAGPDAAPEEPLGVETEGRPHIHAERTLALGTLHVVDGAARLSLNGDEQALASEVLEPPAIAADGRRFLLVHRPEGAFCAVIDAFELRGDAWQDRRVADDGCPDRAALSPDGARIAFVSGVTGIGSVYVMPFAGGEPKQLTNVGLEDAPITLGRAPEGFVAPPHMGPVRFDGSRLRWSSPDGPREVELP